MAAILSLVIRDHDPLSYLFRDEKPFIPLLLISVLLHAALLLVIQSLPEPVRKTGTEQYMVDLQESILPEPQKPVNPPVPPRLDAVRRRTPQEMAPRGTDGFDRSGAPPSPPAAPRQSGSVKVVPDRTVPVRKGEGLFRTPSQQPAAPVAPSVNRLYPSAERLSRLEESYRRKYRDDVAEGDAHFINTNDIQFGSFLRRFESAVYGVWRYPEEAVRLGVEGITPVRIVFNRRGEIESIAILESSGSRLLDEEVLRTLRKIGVVGGFPRGYSNDNYTLIAFFHYGITRGEIRSLR